MITIKEYTEQLETENRTLYEDKNYWKKLAEKRKSQLQQKENIMKEVREYINHYETIRGYYEYEEDGYDEYNYEEDLKKELLEILDKGE